MSHLACRSRRGTTCGLPFVAFHILEGVGQHAIFISGFASCLPLSPFFSSLPGLPFSLSPNSQAMHLGSKTKDWVPMLARPLPSCAIAGEGLSISQLQLPSLRHWETKALFNTSVLILGWKIEKHFYHSGKRSVNVICDH